MRDGIRWLVDLEHWMSSVVFARGISAQELAVRMGGDRDAATEPITDAEAWGLGEWYRPGEHGDGVVRVGEQEGWAFALEYGDSTGGDRLAEISQKGVEAVHYVPMQEHPCGHSFPCSGRRGSMWLRVARGSMALGPGA